MRVWSDWIEQDDVGQVDGCVFTAWKHASILQLGVGTS